jgi:hypothetical protein
MIVPHSEKKIIEERMAMAVVAQNVTPEIERAKFGRHFDTGCLNGPLTVPVALP